MNEKNEILSLIQLITNHVRLVENWQGGAAAALEALLARAGEWANGDLAFDELADEHAIQSAVWAAMDLARARAWDHGEEFDADEESAEWSLDSQIGKE